MTAETMPRTMLSDFLHYLATGDDPQGIIHPDLEGEMNFPNSAFQLRGKAEFDRLRDGVSDEPWTLHVEHVEPTASGFLAVVNIDTVHQSAHGPKTSTSRTISLVTVADGTVNRLAHWCTGQLLKSD